MKALIRTIVCYLCAIICACSLAFAKNSDKYVSTGPNLTQSLYQKFLYTKLGTLYVETKKEQPFSAFDPEKLPEDSIHAFFSSKKGVYTEFLIGSNKYKLNELVFIDLGDTIVKINKSLLIFRQKDGTLVLMTNSFIAHITNKELGDLFFKQEDIKNFGIYKIEGDKLTFQGQEVPANSNAGVATKSIEVASACVGKLFMTKEDLAKIKGSDPKIAKKTVETVIQQQQNLVYSLEAVLWFAPFIGLDTATKTLLEVYVQNQCVIERTALT